MSMPASPKAVPPDAPVVVAYWPDASMDVKMFSTDCAVSDVQPSQVPLKIPVEIVDGFQLANTSAEKSKRLVQFCHAKSNLWAKGKGVKKLVKEEHPYHVNLTFVPLISELKLDKFVQSLQAA